MGGTPTVNEKDHKVRLRGGRRTAQRRRVRPADSSSEDCQEEQGRVRRRRAHHGGSARRRVYTNTTGYGQAPAPAVHTEPPAPNNGVRGSDFGDRLGVAAGWPGEGRLARTFRQRRPPQTQHAQSVGDAGRPLLFFAPGHPR